MHEWERIRSLPSKEKLEKAWRILEEEVWSKKRVFWERNREVSRERDRREMNFRSHRGLISAASKSWQMQVSRGIEGSVEVGIEDLVFDSWGIEEAIKQQRVRFRTEARSIQQVLKSYRGGRSFLDWSTRYRGGVEPAFQNSFSRCEKNRYECNPTYNSTNDPINTKISQNSLSI